MPECYVCLEPCTTPAPCLCKSLYLHKDCQMIMRLYEQKHCGICKTPYEEKIEKPKSSIKLLILCNITMAGILVAFLHLMSGHPFSIEYDLAPFFVFLSMNCCITGWYIEFLQKSQRRQNSLDLQQYHEPEV